MLRQARTGSLPGSRLRERAASPTLDHGPLVPVVDPRRETGISCLATAWSLPTNPTRPSRCARQPGRLACLRSTWEFAASWNLASLVA
jgi:hypothetical protein